MIRYISDLHFFHKNMNDKLDKRGFKDVETMNQYMIDQWNSVVDENDDVVILGDLSFGNGEKTNKILQQLKGNKFLIQGNHDHNFLNDPKFNKSLIHFLGNYSERYDNGYRVVLCHYPILFYNGQYRTNSLGDSSTYMLYGHIHNTQDMSFMREVDKLFEKFSYERDCGSYVKTSHIPHNFINCFCMFSDYKPLTLEEWISIQK